MCSIRSTLLIQLLQQFSANILMLKSQCTYKTMSSYDLDIRDNIYANYN